MSGLYVRSFIMAVRSCAVLAAFGATTAAQADIIFAGGTGSPMTLQFTSPLAFTLTSVPSSPSYLLVIEDAYVSAPAFAVGIFTSTSGLPTLSYLTTSSNARDVRVNSPGGPVVASTDMMVIFDSLTPSSPPLGSTLTVGTGSAVTSTSMSTPLPTNLGLRNVFLVDFSGGQQRTNVLQTTISVVPEPASIGLAAMGGIAAAGWWTLRRRRRAGRRMADGLSLLAIVMALLAAGPADAGVVLTNTSQSFGNGYGFTSPVEVGLGFSTGSSAGHIDGLSLNLMKGSNPSATGSITFSVLLYPAGENGIPSGAALSQDNGVAAAWTNPVAGQLQTQLFTYGGSSLPNLFAATLAANTKYVIAVANDSGTPSYEHYWSIAGSGGYTVSDGYSFTTSSRASDGTNWSQDPFYPIAELSVTSVPEPSTCVMALAGLACGGFAVWRRKRA